jgi:hypothetical protein
MCKKESVTFFRPKVQTAEYLNLTYVKCPDACHCRVACSHRVCVVCYLTCELNLMLLCCYGFSPSELGFSTLGLKIRFSF